MPEQPGFKVLSNLGLKRKAYTQSLKGGERSMGENGRFDHIDRENERIDNVMSHIELEARNTF